MPTITAFPNQARAWVRVEVNWADTPSVQYARVLRYNTVTGECEPLRPYICYDGDYLLLSCGHGIFFDTEVPFDVPVYYITEGLDAPCIPASPIVLDTYTRVVVDGFGVADTGQGYTLSGGTNPANYDVTGTSATQTNDTVNTRRHSWINTGSPDQDMQLTGSIPVANTTGASATQWWLVRVSDVNNWYMAQLEYTTTGNVNLVLGKRLAGIVSNLTAPLLVGTGHAADEQWRVRVRINGQTLSAKAWKPASQTEPSSWQATVTDPDLVAGDSVGMASRLETGSGNNPMIFSWDDLFVGDPCVPCVPVTADTSLDPVTILSNGQFWLRDPVRPCHDRAVPLCFTPANNAAEQDGTFCIPASGIFFASMGRENYEPNTLTRNPTNARRPLAMSRQRRDVSSVLTLVTRTFDDRDALLALAEPGSPLYFAGPAAYGIARRWMDVGTVSFDRGLSDHKYQVRVADLPFVAVDRPAGPTQGTCGSQVSDLCDLTWQDLVDDGFTWDDLVRGRAGSETAPDFAAYRRWTAGANSVLNSFADWNAVDSGTRTWTDLEVGL